MTTVYLVNYLMTYRLRWGQPDTIAILKSSLDFITPATEISAPVERIEKLPPLPPDAPTHFVADTPPEFMFIAMNDWPYSGTSSIPIHPCLLCKHAL